MSLNLQQLLLLDIFEEATILTGKNNLDRIVENVSFMEVPDYENFILDDSIILTTLYPIAGNPDKLMNLINEFHKRGTIALVVKVNRYIDLIPKEAIELAEKLNFPIITLAYNANFGIITNKILFEILNKNYYSLDLSNGFANILDDLNNKFDNRSIVNEIKKIDGYDVLIYDKNINQYYYSNKQYQQIFEIEEIDNLYLQTNFTIKDKYIMYSHTINDAMLNHLKLFIFAPLQNRMSLMQFWDYCVFLLKISHLKSETRHLKISQNILTFITEVLANKNMPNDQFLRKAYTLDWIVEFPISILHIKIFPTSTDNFVFDNCLNKLISIIKANNFIKANESKFYNNNNSLIYIINKKNELKLSELVKALSKEKDFYVFIASSNDINNVKDFVTSYNNLNNIIEVKKQFSKKNEVLYEHNLALLSLFKDVPPTTIKEFVYDTLEPLYNLSITQRNELIKTFYALINCKFNYKATAESLFIHYNTLKYRKELLMNLGYNLSSDESEYQDVYVALHLYLYLL